jgi:cell wall-associated NlpC family hydrolase
MPVSAAEHPTGSKSVLVKSWSGFSAQKARNNLIASASVVPVKVESSQPIQVAAEVKETEVKAEVTSQVSTEAKPVSKPAENTITTQKTTQVASVPSTSQVSRGGDSSVIVKNALSLQGVPYVFGGTTRSGFDCSGFTKYVFEGSGISLPRTSYAQFDAGTAVKKDQLQPGDLVFFSTYAKGASHVGIYIGGGSFVHASNSGVRTTSLSDSYYSARYLGARRVQ